MRRVARESVFKLVFEYTFYGVANEGTLELLLSDADMTEDDKTYISETYVGVLANEESLKRTIDEHLDGYTLARIYRPDLAVLLLATYELGAKSAPVPVIINEAVELSKKYGTDKSGAFVNGVLAKIAKDQK
ncbi:MAG: transcription antitermination factor NusB [Clostridia bacterium]|nr:transcription antitermination factor NusB [Clostridia bacterium]